MQSTRPLAPSLAILALALSTTASSAQAPQADAAVAATETPAENAPQCGQSGTTWLSGTASGAVFDPKAAPLQERLSGPGPLNRAFKVETAAALRLEAVTRSGGDPVLRLFTTDGSLMAENDDASGTYDSQLVQTLEPGTYCVQVDDLRGALDINVQIASESAAPLLTSRDLVCGPDTETQTFGAEALDRAIRSGIVTQAADSANNSYLRFTLSEPAALSLRATGSAGIDPIMAIFDASGTRLAENDDADGLDARLDFQTTLAAGTYCVGLRANQAAPGTISLSAETIDLETYMRRAYARGQLVPLSGDYPVKPLSFNPPQGEIVLQGNEVTWFSFELTETSLVGIRSHGTLSGADTLLRLFDGEGEQLVENDDNEGSNNARIAPHLLGPGRYFVALSDQQAAGGAGGALRPISVLAERFLRAPRD